MCFLWPTCVKKMLLTNGQLDLGDVFHTVQCVTSLNTCSLKVS